MYGFESDEFVELLGGLESEESDESDEYFLFESDERARRPRGFRPRLPTAKRGSPVPRRAGPGYATKEDLQRTANLLDGRIATNSKTIQTLDGRTRALETETARLSAAVKKELTERKTSNDALKKDVDQMRNNGLLLALLNQPTTKKIDGENVVVDNSGPMGRMLPLLLMAGGSSSGGNLLGGGGGDGTSNLIPLLIIMQAMNPPQAA